MEKENQEIIAYRTGDHFLCPGCYERTIKILAVNEIEPPPAEAVNKGDIESFICRQCESMKEWSELETTTKKKGLTDLRHEDIREKENRRTPRDLTDLIDMVDHCAKKVRFISEFFSHSVPKDELWSENAKSGFYFTLTDLEDDLEFVVDQYYHGPNRSKYRKEGDELNANRDSQ
jgi:hypothetical protein